MAIQTITYTNKVDLNTDNTIPAINKVVADDMNQIKNVVNNNAQELDDLVIPGIKNTKSDSTTDAYSCDYVNGTILYENATGTNANIVLSSSVVNYRYVELYYYYDHWAGKIYGSTKIDNPNTKVLSVGNELQYQDEGNMYYAWARITFNGSTLEFTRTGAGSTKDNNSNNTDNQIYIYKVIGYK